MSSKPLVAIVCGLMNPIPPVKAGGPQLVIWNTCKHLSDEEFDWKVLSLWDEAVDAVDFDRDRFLQLRVGNRETKISQLAQKLPYRLVKSWFGVVRPDHLALNLAMVRELKRMKPDVVIVHESYSLCFMVARALPNAKVVFYHHICRMHLDLKQKQWEKLLKSARNGIIAINSTAIPLAIEKFGSSPKNEWVIINGVDDKLIHSSVEGFEPTQKDSNTFTFINVGRITPIKGLDVLIEAMEIVARDSSQKVRLIIVGSAAVDEGGDLAFEAQLKERAGKIGNDIVQFAGFVPNDLLVNYYRQADCGVLPTRLMEGNSLFLMECLAMGVPVIATGIGGVPDVVRDGLDGVLIKKGASAKELAKVMIRMVKERTLWRERSEEIRSSAVQRFTYERVAKNLERVVYDVVNTDLK